MLVFNVEKNVVPYHRVTKKKSLSAEFAQRKMLSSCSKSVVVPLPLVICHSIY